MELFILRHTIAASKDGSADSERPLTAEGRRKMRDVARGMRRLGLEFDAILSSPYRRARETAEIVVRVLKPKVKLELSDLLACEGDPRRLMDRIGQKFADRHSVLLVGHEPYLSELISVLISGGPGLSIEMKKGGLCHVSVEGPTYGRCAVLRFLMSPAQLARRA